MSPPKEFIWSNEEEPHIGRKKAMMAKYGKRINQLMGHEPLTKWIATPVVLLQIIIGLYFAPYFSWPVYVLVAYVVGGTLTHNMFLAIHEISHDLAFKSKALNNFFAMFVNIPIVLPYAMMFKTYHAEHHRYQGWDAVDTDVPGNVEAAVLSNPVGKFFFLTFQIFFYALRPVIIRRPQITIWHVTNYIVMIAIHCTVYQHFGAQPALYWLFSAFMACCFHPVAGHFVSEHYIFPGSGKQETFSYYGPLNLVAWNVGYHNEHHDFPNVAWSKLQALRDLAPEFYNGLKTVDSWPMTLIRFLLNPDMNSYCRVKRERGAGSRKELIPTTPNPTKFD